MSTEYFTVKEVQARSVTTKFGQKNAYDIFSTAGQKYGAGFKAPTVKPGDNVQAEVNVGKYGPDIQTIQVITAGAAPASSASALDGSQYQLAPVFQTGPVARDPYAFANGSHAFPLPQTHGDRTFVRQHALERAVDILTTGGVGVGVPDAADVIDVARQFEAYIAGDDDLLASKAFEPEVEPAKAAVVSVADAIKLARAAVKSSS